MCIEFRPPVGAVSNRTGLECLINSKVHYKSPKAPAGRHVYSIVR